MAIKNNIPDEPNEPLQQGENDDSKKKSTQKAPIPEEKTSIRANIRGNKNDLEIAGRDFIKELNLYLGESFNLKALPKTNVSINKSLPKWFANLDEYGKFYALAVCFYHGVKSSDFLKIPPIIKNHLVKIGEIEKKKEAPSRHPLVETVEVKDPDKHVLVIKYPKDSMSAEILSLVMQKYASLLFGFLPVLNDVVQSNPENWELRWRSAVALGRISELDTEHVLDNIISDWVDDEKAYVRATVGYYYYYLFSLSKENPSVFAEIWPHALKAFDRWARPDNFNDKYWRYKWTSAAICEKVGLLEDGEAEKFAMQHIEKIAGIDHVRIADAVVHMLIEWSVKEKFPQVLDILIGWAESGSAGSQNDDNPYEIRCFVALFAFSGIIEINYDLLNDEEKQENITPVNVFKVIQDNQSNGVNLWNGLISIGIRYFEFGMGNYLFDMIEMWADSIKDETLFITFVSGWFAEIYFNIKSRVHIENRMKWWLKSSNKKLKSTADLTLRKIGKAN